MITCFLRYTIDPDNLPAFEHYARVWMRLIEKYGGTHHGYFLPDKDAPNASFSFPGIAQEGPANIAVALFSFPDVEAYDSYRREVSNDPECHAITAHYERTTCFTKYERTFVKSVPREPSSEALP
jgi:NIPSNAP